MPLPSRRALAAALLALAGALAGTLAAAATPGELQRGEYVLRAGGCVGCHTDRKNGGAFLAGGRALPTDFGTFYAPNLTPDPVHGLGRWTEADFLRALRQGLRPDGRPYYPSFPYPSFTRITDDDAKALWAYLRTMAPVARANTPHALRWPFRWRFLVRFWRLLYFRPGALAAASAPSPEALRGRYLTEALGHCGECHTPRNWLGGLKKRLHLAGTPKGPEGEAVPNLTPDPDTGLGVWSVADVAEVLKSGMTRDGDFVGGGMGEVVEEGTSRLTDDDRRAIAAYLKSLPAVKNEVARKKQEPRKASNSEW